ncbi:MAG: TonB-dependent receptor domain-containing protein [Flavobacteriales bacterium]
MKRRLFVFLLLSIGQTVVSQSYIHGIVISDETDEPISYADILEENSKKWTLTDSIGNFELSVSDKTSAKLLIEILGKQSKSITISPEKFSEKLIIRLKDDNLRLNEVVVSSKKGKNYSEIILGNQAINQVQAFSLNEVLEQLPGQAMTNFNLNEFKPIVFRSVILDNFDAGFGNKSFGTAVIIDDIPVSNNENMQSYSAGLSGSPFLTNFLGFSGDGGYFSNANYGVDLRQIPTNNIDKIEVIEGIPSAKYGDLTSGAIKIQKKAGRTPFQVYTSLRDGATEYGFNKGFKLSEKIGFVNLDISNLKANSNPRMGFTAYTRTNTSLIWSWKNKNNNIKNSLSVNYSFNYDDINYDEENADQKIVKNKNNHFSISNRFKWNFLNKSFFDNMEVRFNYSQTKQLTYESKLVNIGGEVVGSSYTEGVYDGVYTPVSYTSIKEIEGIPISAYFATDFHKTLFTGKWKHTISTGTSFRMSDNKGRGRLGSPESIISHFSLSSGNTGSGFRPYNFGDNVRAEYQFSIYAEDNITKHWSNNSLNVSTGLRYDNMYGNSLFAPRINTFFSGKKYKIRGGFGLTSKAPSLNQIYTGPRYYDAVLADIRLPGYYNLGIVQTFIDYADNKDLKPSSSLRSEIGFDYKFNFGSINLTGYYNKLYNGFTSEEVPRVRNLAELNIIYNDPNIPTYEISGYRPLYFTLNKLVNKLESVDKGIEMFFNIKKLPIKNVTLDIQGSYVETETWNGADTYYRSTDTTTNEKYGVYKAFTRYYKQLRFGANLNYHLPKIGMVISLRSEHFILDHNNYINNDSPYAFIDTDLNKVIIPENDRNNTALYGHIIRTPSSFQDNIDKVFNNFHIRLSKEFLNGFKFSFYANNFLDLKPTEYYLENGSYVKEVNDEFVSLSFGTRIEYQF